jgi:hypothetical protein
MEDLDHEKEEELKEIMEERAWLWSRRRAEGKRWKLLNMRKKSRRSRKKELDLEIGEELTDKDGRSWPWKRIRAEGDHGRKSLTMNMEISWRKKMEDLDHEKREEQEIME